MPVSNDLSQYPHTTPNTETPKLGDLVYGEEGMFALCFIGPQMLTGLLVRHDYTGVVDIPLSEYASAFQMRILVKESINDINPETRVQ